MIFITQTNIGTMVKRVPQEEMSRESFSPLFRVCNINVGWRCFKFLVSVNNLFERNNIKCQMTGTIIN